MPGWPLLEEQRTTVVVPSKPSLGPKDLWNTVKKSNSFPCSATTRDTPTHFIMDKLTNMLDKFGKDLSKYPVLCKAEESTNCPKQYLVLGAGSVLLTCLLMGFGASLICNVGGYVYPAYRSFKAIESATTADDTQWLTYWVVFAAFSILEAFLSVLLMKIPFYFALKLAFLAWCFLPQTRGAYVLYNNFMKDFLANSNSVNPIPGEAKVEGLTSRLKGT